METKMQIDHGFETKFAQLDAPLTVKEGNVIAGYASLFGAVDQGGDVVGKGAYAASLQARPAIKMLWQHDPTQPIGVWEEVREDSKGLYVKGRILTSVAQGREAIALLEAGAIDGLSIGYRTVRASKNDKGQRVLQELELWEVSLVTFPMLPSARVAAKTGETPDATAALRDMAAVFRKARATLAQR